MFFIKVFICRITPKLKGLKGYAKELKNKFLNQLL